MGRWSARELGVPQITRNKYLDSNSDIIFPSLEELYHMTAQDEDELKRALDI
jgi:hypothetical protein